MDIKSKKSNRYIILIILLICIYIIGLIGFKTLFNTNWIDAFFNVSVTTATISLPPSKTIKTNSQKIFISLYALASAIILLGIAVSLVNNILVD